MLKERQPMKAFVYKKYGPPDVLTLEEVEKPIPGPREVLIKVRAVSINASDWEFLTGRPVYTRSWGLFAPKFQILGSDVSGTVEALGPDAGTFRVGEEVVGDILYRWGGFAEYVAAPESSLHRKPSWMSFEEAATLPQAGLVALQGLRYRGGFYAGQQLLVNGGGGGAGTFAIQIGKSLGAEVTGVDSGEKLETMRSLGADHAIDYRQENFTSRKKQYDFILDLAAGHSIFAYLRCLKKNGVYAMVGGGVRHILQTLLIGPVLSRVTSRELGMFMARSNEEMPALFKLFRSGEVAPVLDRRFPLDELPEAMRYFGEGHAKGKVVITV
jgi:NADPH:quinone reductase-like Zn-dependent oxidoreductase